MFERDVGRFAPRTPADFLMQLLTARERDTTWLRPVSAGDGAARYARAAGLKRGRRARFVADA